VLLPALGLRRLLGALPGALRREQPQGMRRLVRRGALLLVGLALGGGLLMEAYSAYSLYFARYVWHQPNHNQSISRKLAQAMDALYGNGDIYLMIWPHWYDGNAVRAQLRRAPPESVNELWELTSGEPPLDGAAGRVLVLMHPDETDALGLLRAHYDRHIVLEDHWEDGSVGVRIFFGER
jgi:hypothetical protein